MNTFSAWLLSRRDYRSVERMFYTILAFRRNATCFGGIPDGMPADFLSPFLPSDNPYGIKTNSGKRYG